MLEELSIWAWVSIGFLALAALVQLYYYWFVFGKLAFYKVPIVSNDSNLTPVSIIISARNEYRNLEKNLASILTQDYPKFEVIVVNDCSWDDSQKLLEYYQENYEHLKVCKLIEQEKYPTGKKFALTIGIKAAQYEQLIFTDADCKPASNQWLRLMQGKLANNKEIVLGFSPFKKTSGFLNLFIRYEGALTAMAYFSAALRHHAFMGVGRNLAYSRDLFFKHKGFASHQHILSGDDDLFVNQVATASNVAIQLHPDSFVYTDAKKTFGDWARQKTRHVSTGKYYKTKDKVFLGVYYASMLLFYLSLGFAIFFRVEPILILGIYGIRLLSQLIIYYLILKKFKSIGLMWFIPLLDFIYLLYSWLFGIKGLVTKQRKLW
ncbi:MAG: glycosyltransferase [Bacteroidetes bacterium]|nr:glycosyltransferase [Bacteroidota bacterium]